MMKISNSVEVIFGGLSGGEECAYSVVQPK